MSRTQQQIHQPASDREFIALENAGARLGETTAFAGTNWTWRVGEQWALLGPDGAGKSLLIEMLLGRVPLSDGELRGPHPAGRNTATREPVAHVSPLTQRQLAVQESSFYQSRWHSGVEEGRRTVAQFLSQDSVEERNPFEVGVAHRNHRAFLRRRNEFVRWLRIESLLSRKLVHLSNGEMRKTLLVHALLKAPLLLILEDPFAGLDVATRRVLHRVIARVIRAGTPVLVATSRVEEIPAPVTHLLIVEQHRIVARGPKREMLKFWRQRFASVKSNCETKAGRDRFHSVPIPSKRSVGRSAIRPYRNQSDRARVDSVDTRYAPAHNRNSRGHPIVEFDHVTITSGRKHILRDVTWTLRAGECWALRGPNGAGKTTLLNLIQGDHPQAYAQNIRWFGRHTDSTQTLWQMRQRFGWMSPELHQHYPGEWSVIDVVSSGFFNTIGLHQHVTRSQHRQARRWLREFRLLAQADEPLGELTFGQQRLVLLARAAVKRPRLLILDEPCQGLDAAQRRTLLAVVDRVVDQTGASLIFVTHHADELPRCVTHLLRLHGGRVREARRI